MLTFPLQWKCILLTTDIDNIGYNENHQLQKEASIIWQIDPYGMRNQMCPCGSWKKNRFHLIIFIFGIVRNLQHKHHTEVKWLQNLHTMFSL